MFKQLIIKKYCMCFLMIMATMTIVTSQTHAVVYDVTQAPFNADGSDTTNDHAAIQQAIDCAAGDLYGEANCGTEGSYYNRVLGEVFIPAGNYYIGDTLTISGAKGLVIRGQGALNWGHIGGNNPTRTGSVLIWNDASNKDKPLLVTEGCTNLLFSNLLLNGYTGGEPENIYQSGFDTSYCNDLLWLSKPDSSSNPDSGHSWHNVIFRASKVGAQLGVNASDAGSSDMSFMDVDFSFCLDKSFLVKSSKSVNHYFNRVSGARTKVMFHYERGGNLHVRGCGQVLVRLVLQVDDPGFEQSNYVLENVRHDIVACVEDADQDGDYTDDDNFDPTLNPCPYSAEDGYYYDYSQLLKCSGATYPFNVRITNYNEINGALLYTDYQTSEKIPLPLCQIGKNAFVVIENSMIKSQLADFTATGTDKAYLVARNCTFYGDNSTNTTTDNYELLPGSVNGPAVTGDGATRLWKTVDCQMSVRNVGMSAIADEGNWDQ